MSPEDEIVNALPDTWRGYFVERNGMKAIIGAYRRPQIGRAVEPLAEDNLELVAFFAKLDAPPVAIDTSVALAALTARLDKLEGKAPAATHRSVT